MPQAYQTAFPAARVQGNTPTTPLLLMGKEMEGDEMARQISLRMREEEEKQREQQEQEGESDAPPFCTLMRLARQRMYVRGLLRERSVYDERAPPEEIARFKPRNPSYTGAVYKPRATELKWNQWQPRSARPKPRAAGLYH